MSSQALSIVPDSGYSVQSVKNNREAITQLLKEVLRNGINADYAAIPGTGDKLTLLKPGAEKICSLFGIAVEPIVEAIRDGDDMTYRVTCRMTSIATGMYLGSGIGEASTKESKYAWRAAVCHEEWEATDPHKRRIHWKKGYGKDSAPTTVEQVREDPNDKANTVLKMSKKRAQIDGVLTCTAASDIFTQDLEDATDRAAAGKPATAGAPTQTEELITEQESKRFYAKWKNKGRAVGEVKEYMRIHCGGVTDDRKMPKRFYDAACKWAESGDPVPPAPKAAPAPTAEPEDPLMPQVREMFVYDQTDLAEQADMLTQYKGRLQELIDVIKARL
jgi:hypothetical protein